MSARKAVIYIAGPFRSTRPDGHQDCWGIQQNVMAAMALGLEVWKRGHVALIPHANTMFFQNAAGIADDQVWLDGDLELIRRCDAVLFTPDWQRSAGARAEHEFAQKHGVPVLFAYGDFVGGAWLLLSGLDAFLRNWTGPRLELAASHVSKLFERAEAASKRDEPVAVLNEGHVKWCGANPAPTTEKPAFVPPGQSVAAGMSYMEDGSGGIVPLSVAFPLVSAEQAHGGNKGAQVIAGEELERAMASSTPRTDVIYRPNGTVMPGCDWRYVRGGGGWQYRKGFGSDQCWVGNGFGAMLWRCGGLKVSDVVVPVEGVEYHLRDQSPTISGNVWRWVLNTSCRRGCDCREHGWAWEFNYASGRERRWRPSESGSVLWAQGRLVPVEVPAVGIAK